MMLALLTGRLPRRHTFVLATLLDAARFPLSRLRNVAPDVPADLAAVVEPAERYASAAAMWADLTAILRRGGVR